MAEQLIGKVKVLVCVRPIPEILASLEKLNRETSKTQQPPGEKSNYFQFQSQEGRCSYWLQDNQVVGLAHTRILDAVQRGYQDRMHFIQYENLTKNPKQTIKSIYDFLKEPYFEHNFEHVEQVTHEDDSLHGYIDLHTIQPKVTYKKPDADKILGPELASRYSKLNIEIIQ
jgi:sulfotransferase